MSYRAFLESKIKRAEAAGLNVEPRCEALFPFQRDIVAWALRMGRAAIFAECGMGKTLMQLEWAARVSENKGNVLILAPLAVSHQTVEEGRRFGIKAAYSRDGEVAGPITITNYEMLHRFCPDDFAGVVLDESSILKAYDGKTRNAIIGAFGRTPYRLACTATPAPNDFMELGNHSEFLGAMSRTEMLSMYFVHDGGETQTWRLKGHAQKAFWEWVSSWGVAIQKPSDLGYPDDGFALPPLIQHQHVIEADAEATQAAGFLFAPDAMTLNEQRAVKRASIRHRVEKTALLVRDEWAKLASGGDADALETRVRSDAEGEGEGGPGISREAQPAGGARPGVKQVVHEEVLPGEAGEVQADPEAQGGEERRQESTLRGGRGVSRRAKGARKGLAGAESGEEEGPATTKVRANDGSVCTDDVGPEREVRDMRLLGDHLPDDVPGSGPLPQDGARARAPLCELQPRTRQVQRQHGAPRGGDGVPKQAWLIWCELNDEQDALEETFGALAFSVRGADSLEQKEDAIERWLAGERPVMISKASILGWGLNFQHCDRMAFVSISHSFEMTYQAIRRCWRYGQKNPVHVHTIRHQAEGAIEQNLSRKQDEADRMQRELAQFGLTGIVGRQRNSSLGEKLAITVPEWLAA